MATRKRGDRTNRYGRVAREFIVNAIEKVYLTLERKSACANAGRISQHLFYIKDILEISFVLRRHCRVHKFPTSGI